MHRTNSACSGPRHLPCRDSRREEAALRRTLERGLWTPNAHARVAAQARRDAKGQNSIGVVAIATRGMGLRSTWVVDEAVGARTRLCNTSRVHQLYHAS